MNLQVGLDYDNMLRVSKTLKALAEKDYFVLVITHDFELIESACDRCLRLENKPNFMIYNCTHL